MALISGSLTFSFALIVITQSSRAEITLNKLFDELNTESSKGLKKPSLSMGKEFNVVVPPIKDAYDYKRLVPRLEFIFYGFAEIIRIVNVPSPTVLPGKKGLLAKGQNRSIIINQLGITRLTIACINSSCGDPKADQRVWSFRFLSDTPFGMYVNFVVSELSLATFAALPVEAWWKKYYAATIGSQHFIGIVAGELGLTVTMILYFERDYEGFQHTWFMLRHNKEIHVYVPENQGYILANCNDTRDIGHITGTSLEGLHPFGVISGNCFSGTLTPTCHKKGSLELGRKDMVAEMMMPSISFGKDFIVFPLMGRLTDGYYFVTASEDNTTVKILPVKHSFFEEQVILNERDTKQFCLNYTYINSDKGIQVVVIQRSVCRSIEVHIEESGDPSLSIIIPIILFYHTYVFRSDPLISNDSYVAVIVPSDQNDSIVLDEKALPAQVVWENLIGPKNVTWAVGHIKLNDSKPIKHTVMSIVITFGCYLYGHTISSGYMQPLAYIVSPINTECLVNVSIASPGDYLDNDCDGSLDEELFDGIDNDQDGLVDEDTNLFKVIGDFEEWTEWACPEDCYETKMLRTRSCKKTHPNVICQGETVETKFDPCYAQHLCPIHCPEHEWGVGCQYKCENCESDCNKYTGVCDSCQAGFQNPRISCTQQCDAFTFGKNCSGNCKIKCLNRDCVERVYGTCPGQHIKAPEIPVAGADDKGLGPWGPWTCSRSCANPKMHRVRHCTSDQPSHHCIGVKEESTYGHCYVKEICPGYCPKGEWGVDCLEKCGNCKGDCDKFDGSCDQCLPGFQGKTGGCKEACGRNTYGKDCEGFCQQKCGDDCVNRATGECAIYGVFGDWQEWHCSRDCSKSHMVRERECYNPYPDQMSVRCRGDSQQTKSGNCYEKKCPKTCPMKKWGSSCQKTCDNCHKDCDKFNGSCTTCIPGYRLPEYGCVHPCEENHFGEACKGNCKAKCGEECLNKINGDCKKASPMKYVICLLLIPVPLAVYCLLPKRQKN